MSNLTPTLATLTPQPQGFAILLPITKKMTDLKNEQSYEDAQLVAVT